MIRNSLTITEETNPFPILYCEEKLPLSLLYDEDEMRTYSANPKEEQDWAFLTDPKTGVYLYRINNFGDIFRVYKFSHTRPPLKRHIDSMHPHIHIYITMGMKIHGVRKQQKMYVAEMNLISRGILPQRFPGRIGFKDGNIYNTDYRNLYWEE
jgi:hypothetical protein